MAKILNFFRWIGKNPKKSIVFGLIAGYGADWGYDKYL